MASSSQPNGTTTYPNPPSTKTPPAASPLAASSQNSADDDHSAETASLTFSILDYPVEWGRRYHRYREGCYLYPNDDAESARANRQYACIKRLHGDRLHFSPFLTPAPTILDVGTGTGIWALEMADAYPRATVTGTDLSAIQPATVPPNLFFEIDDATETPWPRKDSSFDLIHTAMMLGCLASFADLLKTALPYLKPGTGYFEAVDIDLGPYCDDGTMPSTYPLSHAIALGAQAARRINRPLDIAHQIAGWMGEAGYVDIHERVERLPVNPWPRDPGKKRLGRDWQEILSEGLGGWTYKPFREGLGWTREQLEVFLVGVRRAVRERDVHAYHRVYVVWGRRRSEEEEREWVREKERGREGARGGGMEAPMSTEGTKGQKA